MKIFFLKPIMAVLCLVGITISHKALSAEAYQLVWQDVFDKGELDKNNWQIEVNGNGGGNNELQYYRAENVSVGTEPVSGKSCLIIKAKKENYLDKTCTSGRISTSGKMDFTYGKIEASIKLPKTADGLWPAFWMLGKDISTVDWPKSGEIDILEIGNVEGINNGTQETYFNGACHWGTNWDRVHSHAQHSVAPYNLQDDFHLYTLIWDKNLISMYLDLDKYPNTAPYFRLNINSYENDMSPGHYFNKPNFVLFNLAIGGNFTGIWDINKVTGLNEVNNYEAYMYVDYVKVYQRGDEGEQYNGPLKKQASVDGVSSVIQL